MQRFCFEKREEEVGEELSGFYEKRWNLSSLEGLLFHYFFFTEKRNCNRVAFILTCEHVLGWPARAF